MAAPIQTIQAPATTVIAAQPRVVETVPRNLLAMGNVISERVISIEELASMDRYAAAEAVTVQAPCEMIVSQPVVEYVQPAPVVEYVQAPQVVEYVQPQVTELVTTAPQTFIQSQPMTMQAAPMTLQTTQAAPMTIGSQMTYGAPMMTTMAAPQTILG